MNNNKNNTNGLHGRDWVHWLVGLIDAEGNFQVFPKKRTNVAGVITSYSVGIGIHLGMHIRELPIIMNIQSRLDNIGKIYQYSHKNEVHYAVTSRNDIKKFIALVLSQNALLTSHQLQRFNLLNYIIKNDIRKVATREEYDALVAISFDEPVLTNLSRDFLEGWIVGFINGEGSFLFSPKGKGVFTFALEHTDKSVLELMCANFSPSFKTYDRKLRG